MAEFLQTPYSALARSAWCVVHRTQDGALVPAFLGLVADMQRDLWDIPLPAQEGVGLHDISDILKGFTAKAMRDFSGVSFAQRQ